VLVEASLGVRTGHDLDSAGRPTIGPEAGLSPAMLSALREAVMAVYELLRHFYACFPLSSPGAPACRPVLGTSAV
jgi:hypothetical protein